MPALAAKVASCEDRFALPNWDLKHVRFRVAKVHKDWPLERLDRAEIEYRRFVALARAYPSRALSVSSDADEMWHAHILHTQDYARCCFDYAGRFLHHCPLLEGHSRETFDEAGTSLLYEAAFGVAPPTDDARCTEGCSGKLSESGS